MEHLDVGEVANTPSGIDEPPAQLDLFVPVEQLGEVSPDLLVRRSADRARSAQKQCDLPRPARVSPSQSRHMTTRRVSVFVDETKRHGAQPRVILEGSVDVTGIASQHGVVVQESDDCGTTVSCPLVATTRNPEVLRQHQHAHVIADLEVLGPVRHNETGSCR